jgi:uncharacterized cupin superfamily protein
MPADGVSVSHVSAEDWEHDEETGGLVHMLREDDTVQVGLWRPGPVAGTAIEFELEADETLLVLAGSGSLQIDGAAPLELIPGVIVSLPSGAHTEWLVDEAFRELWVYSGGSSW